MGGIHWLEEELKRANAALVTLPHLWRYCMSCLRVVFFCLVFFCFSTAWLGEALWCLFIALINDTVLHALLLYPRLGEGSWLL
jgi:hypothetical protein